jgi:hypothetical protein
MVDGTAVLFWSYTPRGFIERRFEIQIFEVPVVFEAGEIRATLSEAAYRANPAIRDALRNELENVLRVRQLQENSRYTLVPSHVAISRPDGSGETVIFCETLELEISLGQADIILGDGAGGAVRDTKAERIEQFEALAKACHSHPDDRCLAQMLRSFEHSVEDHESELVRLYEIRESAETAFGNAHGAREALRLSRREWNDLGRICNEEPLNQGRHRGKHTDRRRATDPELARARAIARRIIEAYVQHLAGRNERR